MNSLTTTCQFPLSPLGIPILDLNFCPSFLALPFESWDTRKKQNRSGTIHFYIDDYKIEPLWKTNKAERVPQSGAKAAVEPNLTIPPGASPALALWQIYRKRLLARYWQSQGIFTLVDLNVNLEFAELNLQGVPLGWSAYATSGGDHVLEQWHLARQIAGHESLIFIVYSPSQANILKASGYGWILKPHRLASQVLDLPCPNPNILDFTPA